MTMSLPPGTLIPRSIISMLAASPGCSVISSDCPGASSIAMLYTFSDHMQTSHLSADEESSEQSGVVQMMSRLGQSKLTIGCELVSRPVPNTPIRLSLLVVITRVLMAPYACSRVLPRGISPSTNWGESILVHLNSTLLFSSSVLGVDSNHVMWIEPSLSKSTLGLEPQVMSEPMTAESDTTATWLMSRPSASPSSTPARSRSICM